jgi:hypothetical protein
VPGVFIHGGWMAGRKGLETRERTNYKDMR